MTSPPTLAQVALISSLVCVPLMETIPAQDAPARNASVTRAVIKSQNFRIGASRRARPAKPALIPNKVYSNRAVLAGASDGHSRRQLFANAVMAASRVAA